MYNRRNGDGQLSQRPGRETLQEIGDSIDMNLYDITVSVRIRCQATQIGLAEDVVYEGIQQVMGDWVEKLQGGLPDDADKPMVLEEIDAGPSECVVTGAFWRHGALVADPVMPQPS